MACSTKSRCCTIGIFKYLFHIFNLLFLVSGLGVLAIGVWSIFWRHHFVDIQATYTYAVIVYTLLVIGIFISVINVIGYIGVWKENRCAILYFIFLLVVMLLVEVSVGFMSYLYQEQLPEELELHLNSTFVNNYQINKRQTEAIDYIQKRLRCCGAIQSEDWLISQWYALNKDKNVFVPESCCKSPSQYCGRRTHPSNINDMGCKDKITQEILLHLSILQRVAFFIAILQFFGILLSCILCIKIKYVY